MSIARITLLVLFITSCFLSNGQEYRAKSTFEFSITDQPIIHKVTGDTLTLESILPNMQAGDFKMPLEPQFDKSGNISHFIYDPEIIRGRTYPDESENLKVGQPIPDFEMTNSKNEKVTLESFKGNYLIIEFLFFMSPPRYTQERFLKDDSIAQQLKMKHDSNYIRVTKNGKEDIQSILPDNYAMQIIPAGYPWFDLFNITQTPTYLVIDRESVLVARFDRLDIKQLEGIITN